MDGETLRNNQTETLSSNYEYMKWKALSATKWLENLSP